MNELPLTRLEGIRSSYLCQGLSDEEVQKIAHMAREVDFKSGDVVLRQFEHDTDLYVVLDGKVVIHASNGDFVARIKAGGVFGEIALIDERPRSATVCAEADSCLAMIPAAAVRRLMEEDPGMAVKILRNLGRTLCERLRSANLQIEALLLALE